MVKDMPGTVQIKQPLLIGSLSLPFSWEGGAVILLSVMYVPAILKSEAERESVERIKSVRPKTVLCVDDEKIGLRVRKIMLESRGYRVLTANNGPEGLKVFDDNDVDLVVLDYYMPDLNGGEVASEIRRRRPGVPIVFLSAYFSLPPDALELADAFITKGDPPDVLIERIKHLL
jgi:CheY-like chemotaxis protein